MDTFEEEVFESEGLVMVVFGDAGAHNDSCRIIPIVEDMARKYYDKVKVCKKITEAGGDKKFRRALYCRGLPQIVLYRNGKAIDNYKGLSMFLLPFYKPLIDEYRNKKKIMRYFSRYFE